MGGGGRGCCGPSRGIGEQGNYFKGTRNISTMKGNKGRKSEIFRRSREHANPPGTPS